MLSFLHLTYARIFAAVTVGVHARAFLRHHPLPCDNPLPGDHRAHLGHRSSALEVPRLEVCQHSQARENVQRSVHWVQVVAQSVKRFFLEKRRR